MPLPTHLPAPRLLPASQIPALRWGIFGPGWIAERFVQSLLQHSHQRIVAVGSRTRHHAQAFADSFGIPRAHGGGISALVNDPNVDVVYIATPHNYHFPAALAAINAGKHVLVEKPLALNAQQVQGLAEATAALMTAMVVLEGKRPLTTRIQVKPADRDLLKKTHSRLTVGSVLSRRDMLHIALMSSENRAAAALSRYAPGGRPGFLRQMNRKAHRLGMRHSHFVDPTGLSPRNVASAQDVARMARAAWHFPLIRRFSTDKGEVVYPGHGRLVYHSSNGLIHNHHWRIQLQKTGFTNEAGHWATAWCCAR